MVLIVFRMWNADFGIKPVPIITRFAPFISVLQVHGPQADSHHSLSET